MKKLLLFVGAIGLLALASYAPARADVFVDPPSFGRIVYGMTGGAVVLPSEAWEGAYPDGSGTTALPNDAGFGGGLVTVGPQTRYLGDQGALAGTAGANFGIDYAAVGAGLNAVSVAPVFGSGLEPSADVVSLKLGFISQQGWESEVSVYPTPSISPLVTLFGTHTNAGTFAGPVNVGSPFGFAYTSVANSFAYYSDNPANNTGTAANQLYNHIRAYQATSGSWAGVYFIGFEDLNFDVKGTTKYHRFDYNDTVIAMTFEEVPEPAFYQMAGLLSLGAFGLLRLRRRSS